MDKLVFFLLGSFVTTCILGPLAFYYRKEIVELFYKSRVNWNETREISKQIIDLVSDQRAMEYNNWPTHQQQKEFDRFISHMEAYSDTLPALMEEFISNWNFIGITNKANELLIKEKIQQNQIKAELAEHIIETNRLVKQIITACNKLKK